jgi:hypothetical protein
LTGDPYRTFNRLYERFVTRCDPPSRHRRTDDDVWQPASQKLDEKNLGAQLHNEAPDAATAIEKAAAEFRVDRWRLFVAGILNTQRLSR